MKNKETDLMTVCRFCGAPLKVSFADLGTSPLANSYLHHADIAKSEAFYPLHAQVCEQCFLVQLPEVTSPDKIFSDYAYFSSYSDYWLQHSKAYVDLMIERFHFGSDHLVVEIASNDGYLLQYFKEKAIPLLGIEPAKNVAKVAVANGIPTITEFFGEATAKTLRAKQKAADLMIANNVLAHVPDINDFVTGMKLLLAPNGIITVEFPHLLQLMRHKQFDTIYHEHFSYLSFTTVFQIFAHHGLRLFDVDEIPTHGGSLRIYACHDDDQTKPNSQNTQKVLADEASFGLTKLETYKAFNEIVKDVKRNVLDFMITAKKDGLRLVGYGAPAKGNTLLNYCGIRTDFLDYTVDRSPHKQGCLLPGSRIPIHRPEKIKETKPDYIIILPWNIKEEIMEQMAMVSEWGGKFVVLIPDIKVYG